MDIKPREILEAVHGKDLGLPEEAFPVGRVSTDTRTIEKDDVFFALKGPHYDGHNFLKDAIARGARLCVISDPGRLTAELRKSACFIQVPDTLTAYGELAAYWRQRFKVPVVAVTGSAGKTTSKELIAHLLALRYRVLKNRGTENNLIGVPKTILQMDASTEVLVLELGTNRPGEIARLAQIAQAQVGVLTQIGHSHLEMLKDLDGVRAEKFSLIPAIVRGGVVVVNGQDPQQSELRSGVHKMIRVGIDAEGCDLRAEQPWCHDKGLSFRVDLSSFGLQGEKLIFETPLLGRHNAVACLQAMAVAGTLGVEWTAMQKALTAFRPVPGRLALKKVEDILFIDDSYNSNPTSFDAALDTLKEFKIRERKIVVCGDMLELGTQSEALHRKLGARLAELRFDAVIAAGAASRFLVDEAVQRGYSAERIHHAPDAAEAARILKKIVRPGDHVLLKGSRGMKMETVLECFTTSSIH